LDHTPTKERAEFVSAHVEGSAKLPVPVDRTK